MPAASLLSHSNLSSLSPSHCSPSPFSGARFQRRSAEAAALAALLASTTPASLLIPSRNFPGRLFCSYTCHLVNAKPGAVVAHLAGKKLAAARKAVAAGELEAMSEPDLPSEGEEDGEEEGPVAGPGPVREEEVAAAGAPAGGRERGRKAKGGEAKPAQAAAGEKTAKKAAPATTKKAGPPPTPTVEDEPSVSAEKARAARPSRPKRVKR